jgi:anti-sigma-K factor RskA
MTCEEVRNSLADFALGRVRDDERTVIEQHLVRCAECSADLDGVKSLASDLPTVQLDPPPEQYWISLLPRIHERIEAQSIRRRWFPVWAFRWAVPAAAAILVAVIFLGRVPTTTNTVAPIQVTMDQIPSEELQRFVEEERILGLVQPGTTIDGSAIATLVEHPEQLYTYVNASPEFLPDDLGGIDEARLLEILSTNWGINS